MGGSSGRGTRSTSAQAHRSRSPGGAGQTAATQALASAAYRDGPVDQLLKANSDWAASAVTPARISLFEPNLGEAFSRAVQQRMLGGGRKPLIQSFGLEPQVIVEHCLAASRIRKQRDSRLSIIMIVFGLLFLPGVLLWLGGFQLRRTLAGAQNKRAGALGTALLAALAVLGVIFLVKLPFNGFWGIYLRAMIVAPLIGGALAKTICERTAKDLRERWTGLLAGGGIGAKIPEAVPPRPPRRKGRRTAAQEPGTGLRRAAEQRRLLRGPQRHPRHGHPLGQLAARRGAHPRRKRPGDPALPQLGHRPSRPRPAQTPRTHPDQQRRPARTPHRALDHLPHRRRRRRRLPARGQRRRHLPDTRPPRLQEICDKQHFGSGERHYLGVQFVLWDGQLVITMLVNVTVLHKTLRIEVTGHALGPTHALFNGKPSNRTKKFKKGIKFWETWERTLPVVEPREVVRLTARAPLTWYPPLLEYWGGKLVLPEPFGLRHAWADKPWRHRFMADDALRAATPVLRVVHEAALRVLAEHGVDTGRFGNRANFLSGAIQDPAPRQADVYNA
ncbi:hypothetical protein GCM10020000_66310 [Streptomyces olivoverticillatus]